MVKIIPITKAREDLTNIVARAKRLLEEYVITVNGSPAAVIMSADEYESWKETNEILADPGLVKAIKEGEEDIKKGRVYDWEEVKKELGIDVQDKTHRKGQKRTKKYLQTA
jgi:prevent-host-death family protein